MIMMEAMMARACPRATRDPDLNGQNRERAESERGYGPADSDLERCGTCAAWNDEDRILDCIDAGLPDAPADAGYCQLLHFACSAAAVCDSWAQREEEEDEEEEGEIEIEIEPIEPGELERMGMPGLRRSRR